MHTSAPCSYRFVLYVRKSSESEDRQVLSIASQIQHLKEYAKKQGFIIIHTYEDSASAHKINNRPAFTQMCLDFHAKKFDGILCWKADRLARNPIEGGQIIYALQTQCLKIIATPYQTYFPENNMLPLTIEFGMANQYSLDLSKNIKRGNRTKIEQGGWCRAAPVGYLNDRIHKTIIKDPERFQLVRKIFDHYQTGSYSLSDICTLARDTWNFKTIKRPRSGGGFLSKSALHRMLTNPFYAGWVRAGGVIARGKHPALVSQKQFDDVQKLLKQKTGKKYKRLHAAEFPYKGLITCGECHASITAQKKTKYRCPKCKKRHCSRKPKQCSCGHSIALQTIEQGTHYLYYHCTKQKGRSKEDWTKCTQSYVSHDLVEAQMLTYLQQLTPFHQPFIAWLAKQLYAQHSDKTYTEDKEKLLHKKKQLTKKTQILLQLAIDGVLSSAEYQEQKLHLEQEKERVETQIQQLPKRPSTLNVENICKLLQNLDQRFPLLSGSQKKQLLKKIASNCILKDRTLVIDWHPALKALIDLHVLYKGSFEPLLTRSQSGLTTDRKESCIDWWSKWEELRIALKSFELPDA